jgi:hypothetical protein
MPVVAGFLILLATSAAGQIDWKHPYGNPVNLVDGGLCTGLSWVKLLPGEVATVDYGPDFNVYRVHGPGNAEWGAYSGFAAQVSGNSARPLIKKDGVTVYRALGAEFQGYFVEEKTKKFSDQNHFFGNVFKDSPGDAAFFARVTFGPAADAKCSDGKQ